MKTSLALMPSALRVQTDFSSELELTSLAKLDETIFQLIDDRLVVDLINNTTKFSNHFPSLIYCV